MLGIYFWLSKINILRDKGEPCNDYSKYKERKGINVISSAEENNTLTVSDNEMDSRAVEAVKAAINKAKVCKKPIARYDKEKKLYMWNMRMESVQLLLFNKSAILTFPPIPYSITT